MLPYYSSITQLDHNQAFHLFPRFYLLTHFKLIFLKFIPTTISIHFYPSISVTSIKSMNTLFLHSNIRTYLNVVYFTV